MKNVLTLPCAAIVLFAGVQAYAADGCTVLLCLAGNWKNISACVPPVKQALRDLALGKAWPTCDQSSAGNVAQATTPDCPPQYVISPSEGANQLPTCMYSGAIDSTINGQLWSRTWWDMSGDVVVQWFPYGQQQMAANGKPVDDQFQRDYDAWVAAQQQQCSILANC